MSEFSLKAKAVNAATKAEAVAKSLNIWDVVANDIAVNLFMHGQDLWLL